MSSWYSNILTTTTSRISNLRSTWLGGDADGDTEDDTHVCRVLRAYYGENGRPLPGWLPPDPKAPPPAAPVYAQPQVGSRYGGMVSQSSGQSGLSSLWDSNPAPQRQTQQGLRQGRGDPTPARGAGQQGAGGRLNPFARNSDARDDVQARPLPSQRAGNYQSVNSTTSGSGSAQDRLRNRLLGGARTASPAAQSAHPPPTQGGGGGRSYGGSKGSNDYEDRFAPGGMYDATSSSGRGGGSDKPFMAANAPWASNEDEFMGGGSGRPTGLPTGPRRPGGLPNGPRRR